MILLMLMSTMIPERLKSNGSMDNLLPPGNDRLARNPSVRTLVWRWWNWIRWWCETLAFDLMKKRRCTIKMEHILLMMQMMLSHPSIWSWRLFFSWPPSADGWPWKMNFDHSFCNRILIFPILLDAQKGHSYANFNITIAPCPMLYLSPINKDRVTDT